jgi:membrane protein DedA with SNARE-associated domain
MGFADITNTVLDFVRQHPNWSAFIVFGLSLGESLPFVSLVLPFWAMLVGIGTIIAVADPLIFWTIVAAAAVGAALGDWLSYWVGYHYHTQIQQMWPLKNHPKLLDKVAHSSSAGVLGASSSPVSQDRCAQVSLS